MPPAMPIPNVRNLVMKPPLSAGMQPMAVQTRLPSPMHDSHSPCLAPAYSQTRLNCAWPCQGKPSLVKLQLSGRVTTSLVEHWPAPGLLYEMETNPAARLIPLIVEQVQNPLASL